MFYERLAHSGFGFVSVGTRAICNIDSHMYSSIQGTLESNSQYWVAPFVQAVFDQTIKKVRPDIAAMIKQHSLMHSA